MLQSSFGQNMVTENRPGRNVGEIILQNAESPLQHGVFRIAPLDSRHPSSGEARAQAEAATSIHSTWPRSPTDETAVSRGTVNALKLLPAATYDTWCTYAGEYSCDTTPVPHRAGTSASP